MTKKTFCILTQNKIRIICFLKKAFKNINFFFFCILTQNKNELFFFLKKKRLKYKKIFLHSDAK